MPKNRLKCSARCTSIEEHILFTQLSNSAVDNARGQAVIAIHWSTITRPEVRSLLGQTSYGKPQLRYWLLSSRVRIRRGSRLVSMVDVPHSNPFLEVSSRGIFFPVVFCLELLPLRYYQVTHISIVQLPSVSS